MDFTGLQRIAVADRGLAVVSVATATGTVHSSVVNAGVMDHELTGDRAVGFVVRGGAIKLRHIRASSRAAIVFRSGWAWAGVEGPATVIEPDDPHDGFDPGGLPALLRAVFVAAGGSHDDWGEYDRVMASERRAVVQIGIASLTGLS